MPTPAEVSNGTYISLRELADLLAIKLRTIEDMRFRGSLPFPCYQIGRSIRVRIDEVERILVDLVVIPIPFGEQVRIYS